MEVPVLSLHSWEERYWDILHCEVSLMKYNHQPYVALCIGRDSPQAWNGRSSMESALYVSWKYEQEIYIVQLYDKHVSNITQCYAAMEIIAVCISFLTCTGMLSD